MRLVAGLTGIVSLAGALLLTGVPVVTPRAAAATTSRDSKQSSTQSVTASKSSSSATKKKSGKVRKRRSRRKGSWRYRGQQKIDKQRVLEIQEVLIRENYLQGKPTGVWDQKSQSAMQRYQSDNGWQSKTIPDARALIKLGLGPNHDHLLNPESAMTGPITPSAGADHNSRGAPPVPENPSSDPHPQE